MTTRNGWRIQSVAAVLCVLLLPVSTAFAQVPAGPFAFDSQDAAPLLSADQLNTMVAPLALYPDPLLSQVLAASTYPLEIVEAQQWLQQHNNLQGTQLMDAAKQQNWDPSVQALVAFPDALRLLSTDIRWTTDLGNTFLAQQADVMNAVQVMRSRARANGRLTTTAQQVVTENTQDNQTAIEIQPAQPEVIYVPVYNPSYVWGPPGYGAYPDLGYGYGYGYGYGFGPSIYIGGFYPGWGGWGGWGWGFGWYGGGLYVNTVFFNHYGYRGGYYGGYYGGRNYVGGRGTWAHDSGHRGGVPYPNRTVASRYNSTRYNGSRTNGGQSGGGNRNQFNGGNVAGNRTNGTTVNGGSRVTQRGGGTGTGTNGTGWRSLNGDNRTGTNGATGANRQTSPNTNRQTSPNTNRQTSPNSGTVAVAQGNRAPGASNRGNAFAANNRSVVPSTSRSFAPGNSAPRAQSSFAPRASASIAPRQSAPAARSFAAPRSSGGSSAPSGGRSVSPGGGGGARANGGGGGRTSGGGGGGRSSAGGGGRR